MLQSLHISNYALIDSLDIEFHDGFNIITGETGAGKSIMLGALSLLLGERADAKVVRDKARKAIIEAVFDVADYSALNEYCEANDIEWDNEQCIMRREIAPAGRSRAFINDSPVTLAQLETVGRQLIDIHSQHQNQLLQSAEYQLRIIDTLAGNGGLLAEYGRRFRVLREAVRRYADVKRTIEQGRDDEEFIRFQLQQLDDLNPVEGEQDELERQRELLTNMSQIKTVLNNALDALTNSSDNVIRQLTVAMDSCEELTSVFDEAESLSSRLENTRVEIQDIAETLTQYDNDLQADPEELEMVEERLNAINSLLYNHKASTVEELVA
ncbi:MAG: AAA family ATPase, partial [Muribaculaceae bacterium]|nr:AAA family ATPase [Muribaculaceae bacterium]